MNGFKDFFRKATGFEPYLWQQTLAQSSAFFDLLPVPTGLGKTEGPGLVWARRVTFKRNKPRPIRLPTFAGNQAAHDGAISVGRGEPRFAQRKEANHAIEP